MSVLELAELTWTEVRDLDRDRLVAILPVGAVEAHGPHLPLSTDGIISRAMAEDGARRLSKCGLSCLILPPLEYTAAPFAAAFPGTVSVRPETLTAMVIDIAFSLAEHGVRWLAIVNSHLDPTHLAALYGAVEKLAEAGDPAVAFPDISRKPWALRLTEEFRSGACHASSYENSVVLARNPELVQEAARSVLAPNPISLSDAIHEGVETFIEAGGPDAYFGDPAAATAREGHETIAVLGRILEEAVLELPGLDAGR